MQLPLAIGTGLQHGVDGLFSVIPRRRPSQQALLDCKLVSHRGEHDNLAVRENTLAAFERVYAAGVWGLELDVHWSKDLQPVVIHDCDTRRVFQQDCVIAELSLQQLQQQLPEIPSLQQVVDRFGGRLHLMIELKTGPLWQTQQQSRCLENMFAHLNAGSDYHFIALHKTLFDLVEFAGHQAMLPVAEFNVSRFSRYAIEKELAGLTGHYLLLQRDLIERHQHQGQKIGVGFPGSRFTFYRELNRGVDWIFTNHALRLYELRQRLLRDG